LTNFRSAACTCFGTTRGSCGVTASGAANPNRTLLAFNFGGGAKYELSRHFALRGDLRWLPSRANKTLQVQCDPFGNCFQQNVSNYLQRVNFTGGIAFRF
jgi:hypothetical protein